MKIQKIISFLILTVILSLNLLTLFQVPVIAVENDTYEITLSVIYGQTEARKMITAINEFRTGNDAWYWNQDNATKTIETNLSELTYSYELEEIAMKRAAEIALYFGHIRPDGTDCWTCVSSNGVSASGENIAAGQQTVDQAFVSWREDNENYDGQGHRRNMLHTNFTAVGIGHAYYNGRHYWVQEFGYNVGNTTTADNSVTPVKVKILKSNITKLTKNASIQSINVEYEENTSMPSVIASIQTKEQWPQGPVMTASLDTTWKIENENIARIENGKIKAVATGTTNLIGTVKEDDISAETRSTVNGNTVIVPITVTPKSLVSANIEIGETEYEYDKTAKEPEPIVILNGKVIAAENYDITYKNNVKVGTATVSITGKNNYEGTASVNFEITCKHADKELRNAVEATCNTYGYSGDEYCKICESLLTQGSVIDPIDHTPENDYQKDDECHKKECIGCGIIVVKDNHQYGDTYQKDENNHSQECTVCGYIHSELHMGGTATCSQKKVCSVCSQEYGNLDDHNHLNTELRDKMDPTCQSEGSLGDTYCKDCGVLVEKGIVLPKIAHTGGIATCTNKAECTECNQEYGEVDIDNHINLVSQDRIEPTCITDGNTERIYCKDCNKVTDAGTVIPATGHKGGMATCTNKAICTECNQEYGELNTDNHTNIISQGRIEPTCTTAGTTGRVYCDDCNKIINAGTVIPAMGHKGGTATCTNKAVCTECNQEYGELNTDNHTNIISQGRIEPTCTTAGTTGKVYCDDCNKIINVGTVIPAMGHKGGTATCTNKAVCTKCNQEYGELNTDNHINLETQGGMEPTCTIAGTTGKIYCVDCNKIIDVGTVIPATGHKGGTATCTEKAICTECKKEYGELNTDNHTNIISQGRIEPTCTTAGITGKVYCDDCNKVTDTGTVIPATGHKGGTATCISKAVCTECNQEYGEINENNHEHKIIKAESKATCITDGFTEEISCDDCKKIIVASTVIPATGHKGGKATCISKAVCTECNQEYGDINIDKHVNTTITGKVDATCTTEGTTGEIYCNDCNKVVDINKVVPALGHSGGTATCTSKAICAICNQEYGDINSSNHVNIEIRDAIGVTLDKEGYTGDIYCLDCDELVKKGESIAIKKETNETVKNEKSVKKNADNPKTGDNSKIEMWIILAIISSLCMVRILKWKIRKKGRRAS